MRGSYSNLFLFINGKPDRWRLFESAWGLPFFRKRFLKKPFPVFKSMRVKKRREVHVFTPFLFLIGNLHRRDVGQFDLSRNSIGVLWPASKLFQT